MLDSHIAGRLAIFPKCFNEANEVLDEEQLFDFGKLRDAAGKETGVYALSIASEIIARGEGGVHGYGVRSTERQNIAYFERKGFPPDPESQYLGYFIIMGEDIKSFALVTFDQLVRWYPEHQEICHFQIEITPKKGSSKEERRQEKRRFIKHLFSKSVRFKSHQTDAAPGQAEMKKMMETRAAENAAKLQANG